jgi:hypothetical protein
MKLWYSRSLQFGRCFYTFLFLGRACIGHLAFVAVNAQRLLCLSIAVEPSARIAVAETFFIPKRLGFAEANQKRP